MPITVKHCRWLISLIVLLALSAVMAVAAHAASSGDARFSGTIDSLTYTDLTREIRVHGWAWDAAANAPPITITIRVNGNTASASIKKVARPDVQAKLGTAAIDAGFSAIATLPSALVGGRHQAQVTAIFPDEQRMALLDWNSQPAELYVQKARVRHWILLAIILAAILAAYAPPVLDIGRRIGNRLASARKRLYVAITALFLILVSAGITGSSLPLLTNSEFGRAMVNTEDDSARIFRLRWIRADEWLVLSANVLAQWHHQPRFPIINTHLGIEGQNMGVVGMTGVPIAQAASIGRPATWGHFILPLRQALSWQWQLPFFGCLFALLWLLNSLRADRPIANLALALTFCTAPYAAAWSNWPLYATLFPALLLALLHKLATSSKTVPRLILGALAGLVLTGWVLVLYPPWQITVGTFCGLLTVGWWLDQQAPIRRRVSLILALLAGALICALLLGSWWIDTRDGVAQIRSTVYPGARDALQGGEMGAPMGTARLHKC